LRQVAEHNIPQEERAAELEAQRIKKEIKKEIKRERESTDQEGGRRRKTPRTSSTPNGPIETINLT